jgi:hypothetical protein
VRDVWFTPYELTDIQARRNLDRTNWRHEFVEETNVTARQVLQVITRNHYFYSSGARLTHSRHFTREQIIEWSPFRTPAVILHGLCMDGGIPGHLTVGRLGGDVSNFCFFKLLFIISFIPPSQFFVYLEPLWRHSTFCRELGRDQCPCQTSEDPSISGNTESR